ncbi:major facilitator superfamily domain-containing protein [Phlebopus sp. FC_14]|nr:major facilitator superfamily domain-containing protein [Phlebopus sp. FC_14]
MLADSSVELLPTPSSPQRQSLHATTEMCADDSNSERMKTLEHKTAQLESAPASDSTTLQEFPEGGLAAWATAFGAFLVQFSTYGYSISFGVYQDFYAQKYITAETASTISWIGSTNAFLFEICGLLAGRILTRAFNSYYLLYAASFLQAFSLFMLSLAQPGSYYQVFLAQGIGSGCAAGLLYIPSMAVVSHYFDKRREQVMTFVASGAYLGAVVHPIMLNNMINGPLGFANGVRASAGLVSGSLLVACCLMRTRLPPSTSHANFVVATRKCARDSAFIFGCAGLAIFVVAFYYPLFYLQLDAMTLGLDKRFSFYSLVIMNACSFVGQLSSGVLVGYLGVPIVVLIATFCGAVLLFGMTGLRTAGSVVAFGVLYGYFAGIFQALWAPVMALLTPDLAELGVRMGIACAAMAFGGLVVMKFGHPGPPISGALLTDKYIWWRAALFNGLMGIVGFVMFLTMYMILRRRERNEKTQG